MCYSEFKHRSFYGHIRYFGCSTIFHFAICVWILGDAGQRDIHVVPAIKELKALVAFIASTEQTSGFITLLAPRQSMMGKIHVVTCGKGAEKVVQHVMLGESVIGLACTGVNVGPKGQLSLVVLTTEDGDAFAFDVKKYPDIMYQGLGRLLQSVHVLKVVHDSGPVAANLCAQFGIFLQNIFDTQVAYSVVMEKQGLCGRRVPLQVLCDKCCIQQYTPSPQFQKLLSEDVNAWARRPLNRDMLNTAAADALPLVPTLYKQLLNVVEKDSWDWFCVLNDKARLSFINPKPTNQSSKQKESHKSNKETYPQLPVFRLSLTQRALLRDTLPPAVQS